MMAEDFQDFSEAVAEGGVFDGGDGFDAPIEVAVHPVGGADVKLFVAVVEEVIDAGVFEETAQDAVDGDVFGHAFDAGPEAAESADDELDFDAGAGGGIELVDDLGVLQRVHLRGDSRRAAGAGVFCFAADFEGEAVAHVDRGHQQLAVIALQRAAGEVVE